MTELAIEPIIEAALFSAAEPLSVARLMLLFEEEGCTKAHIQACITGLQAKYQDSAIECIQVAGGYRFQAKACYAPWLIRLSAKKPPKYSRAILETMALIAYRQPITRGEIEAVRGVAVSAHIIKTLQERDWIKLLGYKDVPGKPALFGTTQTFLNDFQLMKISDLPPLQALLDLDAVETKLLSEAAKVLPAASIINNKPSHEPSDEVETGAS